MERSTHFQSESIPGAHFTLRTVGRQVRLRAELKLAATRHKARMITQEQLSIFPEMADPEGLKAQFEARLRTLTQEDIARLDLLRAEKELLLEQIRVAFLLVMLETYYLPPSEHYVVTETTEDLLEFGPEQFVEEILQKADPMWGITPEQAKNLQSPSTSAGPVDGQTSNGTAQVAKSDETTA